MPKEPNVLEGDRTIEPGRGNSPQIGPSPMARMARLKADINPNAVLITALKSEWTDTEVKFVISLENDYWGASIPANERQIQVVAGDTDYVSYYKAPETWTNFRYKNIPLDNGESATIVFNNNSAVSGSYTFQPMKPFRLGFRTMAYVNGWNNSKAWYGVLGQYFPHPTMIPASDVSFEYAENGTQYKVHVKTRVGNNYTGYSKSQYGIALHASKGGKWLPWEKQTSGGLGDTFTFTVPAEKYNNTTWIYLTPQYPNYYYDEEWNGHQPGWQTTYKYSSRMTKQEHKNLYSVAPKITAISAPTKDTDPEQDSIRAYAAWDMGTPNYIEGRYYIGSIEKVVGGKKREWWKTYNTSSGGESGNTSFTLFNKDLDHPEYWGVRPLLDFVPIFKVDNKVKSTTRRGEQSFIPPGRGRISHARGNDLDAYVIFYESTSGDPDYDQSKYLITVMTKVEGEDPVTETFHEPAGSTVKVTRTVPGGKTIVIDAWATYRGVDGKAAHYTISNTREPVRLYGPVEGKSKLIHDLYAPKNGKSTRVFKLYGSVAGSSRLIYDYGKRPEYFAGSVGPFPEVLSAFGDKIVVDKAGHRITITLAEGFPFYPGAYWKFAYAFDSPEDAKGMNIIIDNEKIYVPVDEKMVRLKNGVYISLFAYSEDMLVQY